MEVKNRAKALEIMSRCVASKDDIIIFHSLLETIQFFYSWDFSTLVSCFLVYYSHYISRWLNNESIRVLKCIYVCLYVGRFPFLGITLLLTIEYSLKLFLVFKWRFLLKIVKKSEPVQVVWEFPSIYIYQSVISLELWIRHSMCHSAHYTT